MLASGHCHGQAVLLLLVRRGLRQGAENSQRFLVRQDREAPGDLRGVARRAVAGVHRKRRWALRLLLLLPVGDLVLFRLVSRAPAVTRAVQTRPETSPPFFFYVLMWREELRFLVEL